MPGRVTWLPTTRRGREKGNGGAAESVLSENVEPRELCRVGDRIGKRMKGLRCGGPGEAGARYRPRRGSALSVQAEHGPLSDFWERGFPLVTFSGALLLALVEDAGGDVVLVAEGE
jgi:hypothetical protein